MGLKVDPKLLAVPLGFVARLWASTLRISFEGPYAEVQRLRLEGKPLILCIWHDELFPAIEAMRGQGVTAIISRSKDGELIARIAESFGFRTVRGSSSRGGASALVGMLRGLAGVNPIVAVTLDGPRGPRHKAKDGAIYLAQKTGGYIVAGRLHMKKRWVFKSWDRFQLPWPFSRVRIVCAQPYVIDADITNEQFRAERERLENIMESLA